MNCPIHENGHHFHRLNGRQLYCRCGHIHATTQASAWAAKATQVTQTVPGYTVHEREIGGQKFSTWTAVEVLATEPETTTLDPVETTDA